MDNQNTAISQYTGGPVQLHSVLKGLTDADLDLALTTDTWTIRQIVHHIVDGDDMWKTCIKAALGNNTGLFSLQWYWDKSQNDWAANWKYTDRPIEPSLELFRANRQLLAELLEQTPDAGERSIRIKHPEREEERLTIGFVLEMQIGHLIDHIGEIQAIRQARHL
jgi:uncharacterized damage-inducible protein DinB